MLSPYAEACKFESSNLVSISPWKVSTVNCRPVPRSTVDCVMESVYVLSTEEQVDS